MEVFAFHAPTPDFLQRTEKGYRLSLRVPKDVALERAWLRSEPDNEQFLSPLRKTETTSAWTFYEGPLRLNPTEEVTLYTFKLMVGGRQYWLSEAGVTPYFPERDLHFHLNPNYEPARWVWSQVFYQIFPERFYDGDPSNNVRSGEYLYEGKPVVAKAWGEMPDRRQGAREFYGGDLAGIEQKLPYLQDLGVTALYLNPIFTSPSSHKYDTADYQDVDPHFGGKDVFAQLCAALRERGMRIILDAVVNHTSERHAWFDRYGEAATPGAYSSAESPTRGFYTFKSDNPESYYGWYGVKTLPVLNYSHPAVRQMIYENDYAVLRTWLREPYRIDGWRFDVLHMLGEGTGATNNATYARHFRRTLRQENPQAFFLGEHFFEATKWLQGDQEDAAMNYYGFTRPVVEFLAGVDHQGDGVELSARDFDHLLTRARGRIPFEIQLSQFNLLDSHDTARLLTLLSGDKALLKVAVTLLFTYIGVPCVYYGDEIGLEGGHDPDSRRTFPWDEAAWDHSLRAHYQTLIKLRRDHKVLQEGAFLSLYAAGDVYAFARLLGKEVVVVVVNRGDAVSAALPVWKLGLKAERLESILENDSVQVEAGVLNVALPAKSSFVFKV
ncbi:maltodextrin glucosidase [soil metagenome]